MEFAQTLTYAKISFTWILRTMTFLCVCVFFLKSFTTFSCILSSVMSFLFKVDFADNDVCKKKSFMWNVRTVRTIFA